MDFHDRPELIELLRVQAARMGWTQKAIIAEALESYFAHHLENQLLRKGAESTFAEWDNEEDAVYDEL